MAPNETFFLAGPAGRLEAILMHPEGEPTAAAVVCHAHPLHGGIMHFKVLFRVAKVLQGHGAAVLRFNFRGVGGSEGRHDDGRGEQDDARTALGEMQRRFPGLPLVAGGFSFGSVVAARVACADPRVAALLVLGLPLSTVPDPSFLEAFRKPALFVQGERDVFGSGEAVRRLVQGGGKNRQMAVIPGSDHFFTDHLDPMQEAVAGWAAARPWDTPR